jgi:20S proteasome alpha/beta subunit
MLWVLLFLTSYSRQLYGQTPPVIRGTINVVFANANGIVALTDSRLSARTPSGQLRALSQPGQKLFQLDEATVCTFAGFAEAPVDSFPEVINNSAGILQD